MRFIRRIISWLVSLFISRGDTDFSLLKDPGDLEAVIGHYQDEIKSTPDDPYHLRRLGGALEERSKRTDNLKDLSHAIENYEKVIEFTHDDAEKPPHLGRLGNALEGRFKRTDSIGDLSYAILNYERAVGLTPDDAQKPPYLHRLGGALHIRFGRLNTLEDLEYAISSHKKAVEFTPDGDPNKPVYLDGLGGAHKTRFKHLHTFQDLESAIWSLRRAEELSPDQTQDRPYSTLLKKLEEERSEAQRNENKRVEEALVEAERIKAKRIDNTHADFARLEPKQDEGETKKGGRINVKLSDAQQNEKVYSGSGKLEVEHSRGPSHVRDSSTMENLIARMQEVIRITCDEEAYGFILIGDTLMTRFSRLKAEEDLKGAISSYEKAVELTPDNDPAQMSRLMILGDALMSSYVFTDRIEDLDNAISRYQQATRY